MEKSGLNLKATELRLGLPGSESPERGSDKNGNAAVILSLKSFVGSGAKRVFCDATDADAKWVFSVSEAAAGRLFSPRGGGSSNNNNNNHGKVHVGSDSGLGGPVLEDGNGACVAAQAQVVGWPPIRSYRKNTMSSQSSKNDDDSEAKLGLGCLYVKVSMDGAPYLRKVDLKMYSSYIDLSSALEKMFSCFTIGQCSSHNVPSRDGLSESRLMDLLHGSEYVLTYEDKDGDWMLVGDVPWEMFTDSCRRLRIMKSSDAIGLGMFYEICNVIYTDFISK
ncbi:auxin-responsive protein IAA27 [Citrus sinensis]|uniref:Auxin-responsive protein IAA27 n=1 Tax=Citrus sinensis TaxID=2711 RepID=A0ACB8NTV9_CITSI|nr:auxin-responsive protein IAA27 [Citrus sinensis]